MSSLRGPSLMVASMAAFALEDALIKGLAAHVPTGQIALFLGAGGTLVFWLVTRARGEPLFVAAALRGAVLVRNLAEVVAAMCMILSMALVPLSVVSAILQAMPLAVTLGAALFLGEPVGWRRWGAILVGFAGVLMILRPGSAGFDQMALLPLAAVVGLTVRDIATKKVHDGVSSLQLSGWGFVAVLASGVDVIYPSENAGLARDMVERGGLRLSEQPIGLQPLSRHFPVRNRIISGLSQAVVVVEAAARSGSLITARAALDQGREVLAVPGHPFDARSGGCNMLIRDGARLVRGADDVAEALGLALPLLRAPAAAVNSPDPVPGRVEAPARPPNPALRKIHALHRQILDRLSPSPLAEDQLIRDLGVQARDVAPALTDLELDGKVMRQPGGMLTRIV